MNEQTWNSQQAEQIYNVERWSEGYFAISESGDLVVRPDGPSGPQAALPDVMSLCRSKGLRPPVLVRFTGILRHRVQKLANAFHQAIEQQDYQGLYTPVYPIKVNQQRRVVEEILRTGEEDERYTVGLEAGSKPELLAVLALSRRPGDTIICNGYKDEEYIRLALIGEKLGFRVTIVVEKLSELNQILRQAESLQVQPRIGLRVRLSSVSKGKWQNSGGEKSKFGLSPSQLLQAVETCRQADHLESLCMLHFHLGSQVANLQDINTAMREAARFYTELRALGVPIGCMDVGGGLGVDYEGTRSRTECSMNYSIEDYARHIVQILKESCSQSGFAHPDIISESGRALTAHHAALLTNIIDQESCQDMLAHEHTPAPSSTLDELVTISEQVTGQTINLLEAHHEIDRIWQDGHRKYLAGDLTLNQWASVEKTWLSSLLQIRSQLNVQQRRQRELLDQLNEKLASKLFVNFSVFQSVPDVWGIDQIFPVLPLTGFQQEPAQRAVLQDITCDSDGRLDYYVDGEGIEKTLPVPPHVRSHNLGFFMVGAYQEILGDMHNLFGDTDSVDIELDEQGNIHLDHPIQGDTVSSVLRYVNFDPQKLLTVLEQHCRQADLASAERKSLLKEIREGLDGYTYLE